MHIGSAARTTQRSEMSGGGVGSAPAYGLFRTFLAAASLALLLHVLPAAPLGAAGAPAAPRAPAPAPAALKTPETPETPKVTLSAAELPAAGAQKTLLTIDRFGRYSVRVVNAQGSAVELVDRMAGSLGRAGEAGTESGRLDLFLDRGEYQVRVESAKKGSGKVKVLAQGFAERRGAAASPRLVETRLVQDSLDDLEQISYWLEIKERRGARLEAAGRNLADLRLWRDGSWLEGIAPVCSQIQPVVGQPLWRCRLAAVLEPGLYLLTAYGGPAQPWAAGADEHPFYLRWGEPKLPESGRRRYVVSPFGEDHFRLPDNVNFFRLELPEARPATLATGWLRGASQYGQATATSSGAVTKESLPPAAEIRAEAKPGDDVKTPETAAGAAGAADDSPGEAPPAAMESEESAPAAAAEGEAEARRKAS